MDGYPKTPLYGIGLRCKHLPKGMKFGVTLTLDLLSPSKRINVLVYHIELNFWRTKRVEKIII